MIKIFLFLISFYSTGLFADTHIMARHCELFVDKIVAYKGTHNFDNLTFYVKTKNQDIPGKISEVGFRSKGEGIGTHFSYNWQNVSLAKFLNSEDYFILTLSIADESGETSYEGVFYFKTDEDVFYWLKPREETPYTKNGNYFLTKDFYKKIKYLMGFDSPVFSNDPNLGVGTRIEELKQLNPERCF